VSTSDASSYTLRLQILQTQLPPVGAGGDAFSE
jgi:hypothetical protein